jgi:hypothetical protein
MGKIDILKFDWKSIQLYHNEGNDKTKIMKRC